MGNQAEKKSNKPDFPKMEEEVLSFWDKERIFQKSLDKNKGKQAFVFFEGPPTANGRPGIHHVLARAYKDIILRYKTMQGYYVERKAGWDTHGLPVELQVEKELNISGKPDIEKYGVEKFNKKCKESVWQYKTDWEQMTKRIGFWLDLEHPYITYENDYVESLWWIIKQIWDKKLLYKGHKVVPHCPRCGTALSSHEVALGYREVTEDSVYVKFKVVGEENTYLLSWTTTPWTLPGNVALAIGEEIEYLKVKVEKEIFIVAKSVVDKLFVKYKVIEEVKGKQLVKLAYEPLFDIPTLQNEASHKVYTADFVNTEEGTGIVHTAVMYGEDDYQLGEKAGLPKHHTVDENGCFAKEVAKWPGKFVKDKKVESEIIEDLRERGLLYTTEKYAHSYPFCWRCDTPLLYYAKDSWFIRMSSLKEKLIANNETINWTPAYIKQGRFGEWLNELKDWAFSRERYWGTPLPVWECQTPGCDEKTCVGSVEELRQLAHKKIPGEIDLHKPFVDNIILTCKKCQGEMRRVKEVTDVWFDSGSMPFAQWHYPFANPERIDNGISFPADYIAEAIDQTRGWFYTLLAVSTLLEKGAPYKNVTCLGLILDENGKKMSKSKGNIIDPFEICKRYGADPLRWYLFTMNQPGETKLFSEKQLQEVIKKNWIIIWNVITFWKMYSGDFQQKDFNPSSVSNVLDKWIVARYCELLEKVQSLLDGYKVTEAARSISDFINELSTWYVRRSRVRFKKQGQDKDQAVATLHFIVIQLSKIIAPFAPMMAESMYQAIKRSDDLSSVHLHDWPSMEQKAFDATLLQTMKTVRQAVEIGHSLRKKAGLKVRQPLSQFIVRSKKLGDVFADIIKAEMNVQEVIFAEKLAEDKDFIQQEQNGFAAALDTTITDELKELGIVREVVRHINAMRKDAKLTIDDTITLYYEISDETLKGVIKHYKADICSEVVASDCLDGLPENVDLKKVLDITGKKAVFAIKKK